MANKPARIGITGGIGSGKSLVCQIFEVLGVPVYYADDRAKELVQEHEGLQKKIMERFGPESFIDGRYNKSYMAGLVFNAPERLAELNALIHPVVGADFEDWVRKQGNQYPYLVKEAALLLDGDNRRGLDQIFVVTAPEALRIERVRLRDQQRSETQIRSIIARQMPQEAMISQSDGCIDNGGHILLIPQIVLIHQSLA